MPIFSVLLKEKAITVALEIGVLNFQMIMGRSKDSRRGINFLSRKCAAKQRQ